MRNQRVDQATQNWTYLFMSNKGLSKILVLKNHFPSHLFIWKNIVQ